jgi:hypothetical protein
MKNFNYIFVFRRPLRKPHVEIILCNIKTWTGHELSKRNTS